MTMLRTLAIRLGAFIALAAILVVTLSNQAGQAFHGGLDLRAGLLVFVAPVLVSIFYSSDRFPLGWALARWQEQRKMPNEHLARALSEATEAALGTYGASRILRLTEDANDSFLAYAGEIHATRFKREEMAHLLMRRIEQEDRAFQELSASLGFLAKMAPYFGMLATVIGMIQLLGNMSDFTKISGGMALAMQGTLYGLVSFTLLYSPLQKLVLGFRSRFEKRNELIARWFVLVADRADVAFIRHELSHGLAHGFDRNALAPAPDPRRGSVVAESTP
jgi:biopolymer transport protein ExbB/TolQ